MKLILMMLTISCAGAQDVEISKKLGDFDTFMEKVLKDWNAPGIGIGVVSGDKLVFARGYGYRDYQKKLPFTPATMVQIASNTKLFTAVAAGMLVDEGKLTWDKPIRESVPQIRFNTDQLNDSVTLRDMLSHRTGVTRHDLLWYKSNLTRAELFDRLRFLEPQEALRQTFLYNNLMYAAVGQMIELITGKRWEDFVRERILNPLEMKSTGYSIGDLLKQAEPAVPFTERRESSEMRRLPYYEDTTATAPAGAIVSNIQDLSHWLIALMNDGRYCGKQVLPADVLKATLEPAMELANTDLDSMGWSELLGAAYGMGRRTASYRGHWITYHGGDLPGFHTQVSFLPKEKYGVMVFVISEHAALLRDALTFNLYERLLAMDPTPWCDRYLDIHRKDKKAAQEARAKAGVAQVKGTHPSHPLTGYTGEFENAAYGSFTVSLHDELLKWDYHKFHYPLAHFHYDRFDTPDDESDGKFSLNFRTNPQGDCDQVAVSMDHAEILFTRKPPVFDPKLLSKLAGSYEMPSGVKVQISYSPGTGLTFLDPEQAARPMQAVKELQFRLPERSDLILEFIIENGEVKTLKLRDPSGEFSFPRK